MTLHHQKDVGARTALYRHYRNDGRLLYVGITDGLTKRDKAHARASDWHADVQRTETEWCLSREHALALERVAIRFECPLHNRAHMVEPVEDGEKSIRHLISLFGTRRALAEEIGADTYAVHKWARFGRIPASWHAAVIRAAHERGLLHINGDWLAEAHAASPSLTSETAA